MLRIFCNVYLVAVQDVATLLAIANEELTRKSKMEKDQTSSTHSCRKTAKQMIKQMSHLTRKTLNIATVKLHTAASLHRKRRHPPHLSISKTAD